MNTTRSHAHLCLVLASILLITGSAAAGQAKKVTPSGFLGDYSQLEQGKKGEARLHYVDPAADFGRYTQILMDPITVYATDDDSNLNTVPENELKSIIDYLDSAVRTQLAGDYVFVNEVGPETMRLRIAITEAKGANVALNTASSVTPAGLALSGIKKAVTGASTGVAKAGVEMELLDAQTGKRLAAAVDARAGKKKSSFSKWQGVQEAYDYWAHRLKERLNELRAK